jgi:predicted dehydrogenase
MLATDTKPIRAALIGTGRIAQEHLACLRELPGVEIAGVCDRHETIAEMTADRFGVKAWYADHRAMLAALKPDVVHITTPPTSHVTLALDALDAGCHVLVEKPITPSYSDFLALKARAEEKRRLLIENHNYVFNASLQTILGLVKSGEFGEVRHVDVFFCVAIFGAGSPFADPNLPHSASSLKGGTLGDFLPHLASLAHAFVGRHRAVRTLWPTAQEGMNTEFRAMVDAERGTASLGLSTNAQPNAFWVRVYGTKMQAEANLLEPHLTVTRLRSCHAGLMPLVNGMTEAWDTGKSAVRGFWGRLANAPLANEGIWELLRQTYAALKAGTEMPVSIKDIDAVSRLVEDLTAQELRA